MINAIKRLFSVITWLMIFTVLGALIFSATAPNSWWFTYDKFFISNAMAGDGPPTVALDRTFNRDFSLRWFATLKRKENGTFVTYVPSGEIVRPCKSRGEEYVYPDFVPEDPGTLARWFENPKCVQDLRPGSYYVEIFLEWDVIGTRTDRQSSNVFTVDGTTPHTAPSVVIVRPQIIAPHHRSSLPRLPWPFRLLFH